MASEKRKAAVADRPAKRSKPEHSSDRKAAIADGKKAFTKPEKQERQEKEPEQQRPVKASILQSEDRAFPRGGASVLTPLEHKQIKLDADRDVLFEQSGRKKATTDYSDEEGDNAGAQESGQTKKRKKISKRKSDGPVDGGLPHVKIQGLSYKSLVVNSLVLGQVTQITSRDVALALPNNLTGFVPFTSISDKIYQRIEALSKIDEDKTEQDKDDQNSEDLDLKSLFHVGQFLRACVISTADDATARVKSKKRIELSVKPQDVNAGLVASSLKVNNMIQASVRSVEDHGLVMDLGLEDASVRGFVSKKELGKSWDIARVEEGQVMMCSVTGLASDGKVVKLCPDTSRIGDTTKHYLSDAATVDAFVPGTAVEILVTESGTGGLSGKIMGMLDATADITHSGAGGRGEELAEKYKIGSKVKARVICTFPSSETKKVGVSLLDHVKLLQAEPTTGKKKPKALQPSLILDEVKVIQVEPAMGLYLDVGVPGRPGFAHISRLSDSKVDNLSGTTGPYKIGSTHKARVLGFNPIDGVYNVSLEKKILEQPFLRIEDVEVGQVVKGTVDKLLLGAKGVVGVLVNLAEGISGLAPEMHLADVHLQHPEKKFREGFPVKARVLSVDIEKKQIRLTMKKTLLNSETSVWKDYHQIAVGDESLGTIISIRPTGAVVQFYGTIRAWLPVAEMSEAYISDPAQHFRIGQTVSVHALSVDAEAQELKVSCKDSTAFGKVQEDAWAQLKLGELVGATVTEKSGDNLALDIDGANLKATLRVTHLIDGSDQNARSALKQIRVGQKLSNLLVLEKREKRHLILLSNKASLVKAAKSQAFITAFEDVKEHQQVQGFVRNVTPDGIFVEFAGAIVGFLPKTQITLDKLALPAFGVRKDQSIAARVLSVDRAQQRFVLTWREESKDAQPTTAAKSIANEEVINPIDGESTSISDFTLGKQTQARIVSIKDTQLNVQLADNIQGRIDVSEVFDSWDEIKDHKRPLQKFKPKQILAVKILGIHDARNHRFLPITHRQSRIPVFELTAKSQNQLESDADVLTMDKIEVGSSWTAYVNNIGDNCLWVNLSPNVRGRIDGLDVSDDVSLLQDMANNFPVGSAIRVSVKSVDVAANRLDLTASLPSGNAIKSISDLTVGTILPGKVVKVTERSVMVALSDTVTGAVTLTELADDLTEANPTNHSKNDIVRVCVIDVDLPNKRVFLSMRPSKTLSSALPVEDGQVTGISQLNVNDVLRGFVKTVRDNGVIVNLGPRVDAFVRVSDLSDAFIKDWKSAFEVDQLVKGKVLAVDAALNHVQLSLKASHVDKNYVPPNGFGDLKAGQIVTGKVRKVEDFGVFIDVDDTQPRVSGLCHRSQIADNKVEDVTKLYDAGDSVKAKILHIDVAKKRISFGLKASYFRNEDSDDDMEDDDEDEGVGLDAASDDSAEHSNDGVDLSSIPALEAEDSDNASSASDMDIDEPTSKPSTGLATSGFDWTGESLNPSTSLSQLSDSEAEATTPRKRKRKAAIQIDHTADLDAHGPRSVADYERLLLSSPSSSALWIQYMAFQLRLSEVQAARDIGQRALRTIPVREEGEKQAVWIALLNLEVAYGDAEAVESVFRDACATQDPFAMHERLAGIYIEAGAVAKAADVFERMVGTKAFRPAVAMWLNYATFLFEKKRDADAARALLPRALQSVHASEARALTAKFAALEFRTKGGDAERGRTIFEGLVADWPKWTQGWDMWVDLEKSAVAAAVDEAEKKEGRGRVAKLFERMAGLGMKKRRARFVFKRWLEFEEESGDAKGVERVKALAKEYVEGVKGGDDE